jgi:hypothetical protein
MGRPAMTALISTFFQEGLQDGNQARLLSPSAGRKYADVPINLAAISKVPAAGWGQVLAFMALGGTSQNPAEKIKKLTAKIANGRCHLAIIGAFFQDGLIGPAWGDRALYTASPPRAFGNELGMQAPGGLWDPAASPRIAAPLILRTVA